jgi:hypothetical protein
MALTKEQLEQQIQQNFALNPPFPSAAIGSPASGAGGASSTTDQLLSLMLQRELAAQQQNTSYVDHTLVPDAGNANWIAQQAQGMVGQNLGRSASNTQNFIDTNNSIVNQIGGIGSAYNQAANQGLQNFYTNTNNNSQAGFDLANQLGQINATQYGRITPTTSWAGDLTSQAAGARANPGDVANQNAILSQLMGAAGGSLNVTSQGAQAYADPQAVQMQMQALGQLQGAASGALDWQSQAAQAYADPAAVQMQNQSLGMLQQMAGGSLDVSPGQLDPQSYAAAQKALGQFQDVYGGSLDIQPGQLDPAAWDAQHSALSQLSTLTNPQVTAQEQFNYEQQRQAEEQDRRASQAATLTDLRQRGMAGSGMELANQQLGNQTTSQNRLLGDLGTQATAVQRAMTALQNYGALSTDMTSQANALAQANQGTRMSGLADYGQMGSALNSQANQLAMANQGTRAAGTEAYNAGATNLRNETFAEAYGRGQAADAASAANQATRLNATDNYAQQTSNLRDETFNEAYARGTAADQVNTANSNRQLGAMDSSSQLATNMRNQGFAENFSTGQAADQMSQYNRTQSIGVNEFRDNYAAGQQNDAWSRQLGVTGAGFTALQNQGTNLNNQQTQFTSTNNSNYLRDLAAPQAASVANGQNYGAVNNWLGQSNNYWAGFGNIAQNQFSNDAAIGSARSNAINAGTQGVNGVLQLQAGQAATNAAVSAVNNQPVGLLDGFFKLFG